MRELHPCDECGLHVEGGDCLACGGTTRATARSSSRPPRSRLTRVAILAGATMIAACGGSQNDGTSGDDSTSGDEDDETDEGYPPAPPYGAPPFDDGMV